jgi:hypothetical protein
MSRPLAVLGSRLDLLDQYDCCRGDFVTFEPSSGSSRVCGLGVDVLGSGTIQIAIPIVYGQIVRCNVHEYNL